MQASDLTKFRFAASIAGPYCSACNAGGVGPAGPTGPTGPSGGGSAATWSQFPATQNVDMSCNLINDVSGINFCDGTYIGPGGSFDISSNDAVKILTGGVNGIELAPGSGTTTISGGSAGIAKLQLSTAGDTTVGSIRADDAEAAVLVETTADLYLNSGGSTYVKTTNATGNILLQVDGDSEATLGSSQFQVASVTGNATVRVQGAGGKGGEITLDEAVTGAFVFEGKNGLKTVIQNETQDIKIISGPPAAINSELTIATDGSYTLTENLSDHPRLQFNAQGGAVTLEAGANGNTNKSYLKAGNGVVSILGDSSIPILPTLEWHDTTGSNPSITMTGTVDGFGLVRPQLKANAAWITTETGAGDGLTIGTDATTNMIFGNGFPLRMSQTYGTNSTDYIEMNIGVGAGGISTVTTDKITLDTPELSINNVPNTPGAGNAVTIEANSAGLTINKWLKVLYNGSYIWIPFLDTDPSI